MKQETRPMQQKYELLGFTHALSNRFHYAQACDELAVILRKAYCRASRKLQNIIFQDVLLAVRRLQELETIRDLTAVSNLVQAAEAVLQRQRKVQVVSEYKHAAVIQRRRKKFTDLEEGTCCEFDLDILGHIFRLLDARCLVTASAVCRSWRNAANDEFIWKNLYTTTFESRHTSELIGTLNRLEDVSIMKNTVSEQASSWKQKFKDAIKRKPSLWFSSSRAFCRKCNLCVWLRGDGFPICPRSRNANHTLKALVPDQVVQFLLDDQLESSSSSSSDSDSDHCPKLVAASKLWALPRLSN